MRACIPLVFLFLACGTPPHQEAVPEPSPPEAAPAEPEVANACADRSAVRADLSERDDGRGVELHPGEEVCIQLPGNRDQGYAWGFNDSLAGTLELVGTPGYARAVSAGSGTDSWGMESWRLRALKPGKTTLRFDYMHASDEPIPAERTLSFPITVR